MSARTMFRTRKGEYVCFSANPTLAECARRAYPELKGGRITNVLQMMPSQIVMGRLYKSGEIQPDRQNLQARNVGVTCTPGKAADNA